MIIRLFRDNQIFTVLMSTVLGVVLWILSGIYAAFDPIIGHSAGSVLINNFSFFNVLDKFQLLAVTINILVLFLCSFYINRLIIRYQIIPNRTSLPSFIFILITTPYFNYYKGISYSLISLFFMLIILDLLFKSIDSKNNSRGFFDGALILSFASLFNFYFIFFGAFLIFVWIQFRWITKWRELVYIILGIIIPYMFYFGLTYFFEIKTTNILKELILPERNQIPYNDYILFGLGIFTGLLILISSVHLLRSYVKMKIITRKYSLIYFSVFVVVLLIALLYPGVDIDIIFFFSLPVSFLFGYYFSTCTTKIFNQAIFVLLIALNIMILILK